MSEEFSRKDIHDADIKKHLDRIHQEFEDGFDFLKKYPKTVTIFGSSRTKNDHEYYKKAEELAGRIVKELNYAVVTGGGPGIMEAANKGAYDAGGPSLGLNISLPRERVTNAYATHSIKFTYFFSRKTMLMFSSEAWVFFPGGFGTLDELFNILTLEQTGKLPKVPILLFGSSFWNELKSFLEKKVRDDIHAIENDDMNNLFEITDSLDRILEVVKSAPVSEWWRNIN